jgi:hypothetical protein
MLYFSVPKAEVERINDHIKAVAQADQDSNSLVYMMDDMMKEDENFDPIIDAVLALDNFDGLLSNQLVTSN